MDMLFSGQVDYHDMIPGAPAGHTPRQTDVGRRAYLNNLCGISQASAAVVQ